MVKPNKLASQQRKSENILKKPQPASKGQDSRKVHDTKGKNQHGRMF